MANFDTAAKRFSGMGFGLAEAPLLPIPSGTFDQGDRQHFLDAYSGILWAAAVVVVGERGSFPGIPYFGMPARGHGAVGLPAIVRR